MDLFVPPPETYYESDGIRSLSSTGVLDHGESVAIVTDSGVREAGLLDSLCDSLTGTTVFDETESNPSIETVTEVADAVADADVVVGVGGGSVMDATKAACALPAFGTFADLRSASPDGAVPDPAAKKPFVLIPTTAGTGTETGYWAVISDHDEQVKLSVGHPSLKAEAVVLDPTVTASLPPSLTAMTGFDVITHAVEAFASTGATSLTDPYARTAFSTAVNALPRAVSDRSTSAAREQMLVASYQAGTAMNNAGLGAVHGISHAIGGLYDTPHGHTNALLLPEVIAANEKNSERARLRYDSLTKEIGAPGTDLASRIETLLGTVGLDEPIPQIPAEMDLDTIAEHAVENINMETNPGTLDHETIISICRSSFDI